MDIVEENTSQNPKNPQIPVTPLDSLNLNSLDSLDSLKVCEKQVCERQSNHDAAKKKMQLNNTTAKILVNDIKKLSDKEQNFVHSIIQRDGAHLTRNENGTFVRMNQLKYKTIEFLYEYVESIKDNRSKINETGLFYEHFNAVCPQNTQNTQNTLEEIHTDVSTIENCDIAHEEHEEHKENKEHEEHEDQEEQVLNNDASQKMGKKPQRVQKVKKTQKTQKTQKTKVEKAEQKQDTTGTDQEKSIVDVKANTEKLDSQNWKKDIIMKMKNESRKKTTKK